MAVDDGDADSEQQQQQQQQRPSLSERRAILLAAAAALNATDGSSSSAGGGGSGGNSAGGDGERWMGGSISLSLSPFSFSDVLVDSAAEVDLDAYASYYDSASDSDSESDDDGDTAATTATTRQQQQQEPQQEQQRERRPRFQGIASGGDYASEAEMIRAEAAAMAAATRRVEAEVSVEAAAEARRDAFLRSLNYTDDTAMRVALARRVREVAAARQRAEAATAARTGSGDNDSAVAALAALIEEGEGGAAGAAAQGPHEGGLIAGGSDGEEEAATQVLAAAAPAPADVVPDALTADDKEWLLRAHGVDWRDHFDDDSGDAPPLKMSPRDASDGAGGGGGRRRRRRRRARKVQWLFEDDDDDGDTSGSASATAVGAEGAVPMAVDLCLWRVGTEAAAASGIAIPSATASGGSGASYAYESLLAVASKRGGSTLSPTDFDAAAAAAWRASPFAPYWDSGATASANTAMTSALPDPLALGRLYPRNAYAALGALRAMIASSSPRVFGGTARECAGASPAAASAAGADTALGALAARRPRHWLWGVAADVEWMRRSGRLGAAAAAAAPGGGGIALMDTGSWWSRVALLLTAAPLVAFCDSDEPVPPDPPLTPGLEPHSLAALADVATTTTSSDDSSGSGGRRRPTAAVADADARAQLSRPAARGVVDAWRRAWDGHDPRLIERLLVGAPPHPAHLEHVRAAAGRARAEAAAAALAMWPTELAALPRAEREYARGWARVTALRAAARVDDSLEALLRRGAGHAPERVLTDAVIADGTAHLPLASDGDDDDSSGDRTTSTAVAVAAERTRREVAALRCLGRLPAPIAAAALWLLQRACGTYPGRHVARRLLPAAIGLGFGRWRLPRPRPLSLLRRHHDPAPTHTTPTAAVTAPRTPRGRRRAALAAAAAAVLAWAALAAAALLPQGVPYRKLTPPLGIDLAEDYECDPVYDGGASAWGSPPDLSFLARDDVHPFHAAPSPLPPPLPPPVTSAGGSGNSDSGGVIGVDAWWDDGVDVVGEGLLVSAAEAEALAAARAAAAAADGGGGGDDDILPPVSLDAWDDVTFS